MDSSVKKGTFSSSSGFEISYDIIDGAEPYIFYAHGLTSDKRPIKNDILSHSGHMQNLARKLGVGYIAIDVTGHGESGGDFVSDFSISAASKDFVSAIKKFDKDILIVANSMGFWPSIRSMQMDNDVKSKVKGLVGISIGPDHHQEVDYVLNNPLLIEKFGVEEVDCNGTLKSSLLDFTYTMKYLEDCDDNAILNKPIEFDGPVTLIHGQDDFWITPVKAAAVYEAFTSKQAILDIVPNTPHHMHSDDHHRLIDSHITKLLLKKVSSNDVIKARLALDVITKTKV